MPLMTCAMCSLFFFVVCSRCLMLLLKSVVVSLNTPMTQRRWCFRRPTDRCLCLPTDSLAARGNEADRSAPGLAAWTPLPGGSDSLDTDIMTYLARTARPCRSGGYRRTWRRRWRRAAPWSAISRLDDLCCFSSRLTLSSARTRPVSRVKASHFAAAVGQSARFRRNFAVLDHRHIFLNNVSVGLYCNWSRAICDNSTRVTVNNVSTDIIC